MKQQMQFPYQTIAQANAVTAYRFVIYLLFNFISYYSEK